MAEQEQYEILMSKSGCADYGYGLTARCSNILYSKRMVIGIAFRFVPLSYMLVRISLAAYFKTTE